MTIFELAAWMMFSLVAIPVAALAIAYVVDRMIGPEQ